MVPTIVFLFITLSEIAAYKGQSQNSGSWMEHPTRYQNSGIKETREPNQLTQNDNFQLKANNFRMEVTGGESLRPPAQPSDDSRSQDLDNLSQATKNENIPEQSQSEFISVLIIDSYKCFKQVISISLFFTNIVFQKYFLNFLVICKVIKIS